MKRQTILKYSCCDLCGGTLIWLKATPSFMLWRKRPCQTEAQNNGGQPRGNRAICMQLFAVSRTTKANQRILNGGWQASANAFALCLCQPSPLCLPSQSGPCFFFSGRAFLNFFSLSLSWCRGLWRVKGWSRQHSWEGTLRAAKITPNMCVTVCRVQSPNGDTSTPNLHYLFASSPGF